MPLPLGRKYDIIYADPPWKYVWSGSHSREPGRRWFRAMSVPYASMSERELKALPVAELSKPDSLLFMWSTSQHLGQAVRVMESWGWRYKAVFQNWIKTTSTGKDASMPGYYSKSQSEFLLVGVRGRPSKLLPRGCTRPRQLLRAARSRHSTKPREAMETIERCFLGTDRIELFARSRRDGWDAWGDQLPE